MVDETEESNDRGDTDSPGNGVGICRRKEAAAGYANGWRIQVNTGPAAVSQVSEPVVRGYRA